MEETTGCADDVNDVGIAGALHGWDVAEVSSSASVAA
jgi:hypothetical protein